MSTFGLPSSVILLPHIGVEAHPSFHRDTNPEVFVTCAPPLSLSYYMWAVSRSPVLWLVQFWGCVLSTCAGWWKEGTCAPEPAKPRETTALRCTRLLGFVSSWIYYVGIRSNIVRIPQWLIYISLPRHLYLGEYLAFPHPLTWSVKVWSCAFDLWTWCTTGLEADNEVSLPVY